MSSGDSNVRMIQDVSWDQMCGPQRVAQTVGFEECYRKIDLRCCDFGYCGRDKDQYLWGWSLVQEEMTLDGDEDQSDRFLPEKRAARIHCILQ